MSYPTIYDIPDGLCPVHASEWLKWRSNRYDRDNPSEWPGGLILQDNRTTHGERRKDWEKKNVEQMTAIAELCLSRASAQCGDTPVTIDDR